MLVLEHPPESFKCISLEDRSHIALVFSSPCVISSQKPGDGCRKSQEERRRSLTGKEEGPPTSTTKDHSAQSFKNTIAQFEVIAKGKFRDLCERHDVVMDLPASFLEPPSGGKEDNMLDFIHRHFKRGMLLQMHLLSLLDEAWTEIYKIRGEVEDHGAGTCSSRGKRGGTPAAGTPGGLSSTALQQPNSSPNKGARPMGAPDTSSSSSSKSCKGGSQAARETPVLSVGCSTAVPSPASSTSIGTNSSANNEHPRSKAAKSAGPALAPRDAPVNEAGGAGAGATRRLETPKSSGPPQSSRGSAPGSARAAAQDPRESCEEGKICSPDRRRPSEMPGKLPPARLPGAAALAGGSSSSGPASKSSSRRRSLEIQEKCGSSAASGDSVAAPSAGAEERCRSENQRNQPVVFVSSSFSSTPPRGDRDRGGPLLGSSGKKVVVSNKIGGLARMFGGVGDKKIKAKFVRPEDCTREDLDTSRDNVCRDPGFDLNNRVSDVGKKQMGSFGDSGDQRMVLHHRHRSLSGLIDIEFLRFLYVVRRRSYVEETPL